jgi:hypothetical protein
MVVGFDLLSSNVGSNRMNVHSRVANFDFYKVLLVGSSSIVSEIGKLLCANICIESAR